MAPCVIIGERAGELLRTARKLSGAEEKLLTGMNWLIVLRKLVQPFHVRLPTPI